MNKNEINNKCRTKNYDIVQVLFPKGTKDQLKLIANDYKMTLSEFVIYCVNNTISNASENMRNAGNNK